MAELASDPFQAARLVLTLRRAGVTDNSVLSVMEELPRSQFISEDASALTFEDAALPIECGQTNLRPTVTGHLLQLAEITAETDRVLLVGLGSGYTAALLARLAQNVFAIERHKTLFDRANERLAALGIEKVKTRHADGLLGWADKGMFDRIILTGLADHAPVALLQQLTVDGRLIQPILDGAGQKLCVYEESGSVLNTIDIIGFQALVSGTVD